MSKLFALLGTMTFTLGFAETHPAALNTNETQPHGSNIQVTSENTRRSPVVKPLFSPFTGRVVASKVRMRLQPDLNGHIVEELVKNDFVKVINQEGDFYSVEPPESLKAYIFRSFVIDNVVEGNRVNVRLEPDLEAPVIGHLNSGDKVEGTISEINKKWLEISPPANTQFYIAKDYIEKVGGPDYKAKMESRKATAEQYFEAAQLYSKSEMQNPFEEINFERVKQGYLTIVNEYADFPQVAQKAKEALHLIQDDYLQKRIAYLEEKATQGPIAAATESSHPLQATNAPAGAKMWETIEQGLYANWAATHDQQDKENFYEEQRLAATSVSGIVEPYKTPVKNRPGDFVIKNKNLPVAYVYSTMVDLEDYVGKKVNLICSPRPNHSFAFPAYYVLEVE